MSFISDLYNNFVVKPVAKQLLDTVKASSNSPAKYDVPFSVNSQSADMARRHAYSQVSFQTLRQLSINHETSRAAINVRKRQITQLDWDIIDKNPAKGPNYSEDEIAAIKVMIENIGGPAA